MVYEFLIQTGIALGNEKSQLLLEVEKQVWRMLFQMVEGRDLDSLLLELVECISWDALAAAPASDRRWFSLSETSSQMATSSLHEMTSSPTPQQSPSLTPTLAPPLPPQTLIAQERARSDIDLSTDSGNPEQLPSQLFLLTTSTSTSTQLPPPPQSLMTLEGAQSDMYLGPDSGNRELVEYMSWDALADAPASDRRFSLSETSSQMATSLLHQVTSFPALPPQSLMTQEGAQFDMDLGPDSGNPEQSSSQLFLPTVSTPLPQADVPGSRWTLGDAGEQGEDQHSKAGSTGGRQGLDEAMDLDPDSGNPEPSSSQLFLATTSTPLLQPDLSGFTLTRGDAGQQGEDQHSEEGSTGRRQDLDEDKVEDHREDELGEEEQQSSGDDSDETMASPAGSQSDTVFTPSPRLPKKRPATSAPQNATKKKRRRPAMKDKKPMPTPGPSRETALGRLLAAGETFTMPIDVEAVDKLMQNFPITEEHQVRSARVDSLKLYLITFRENRFSQKTFPCQV